MLFEVQIVPNSYLRNDPNVDFCSCPWNFFLSLSFQCCSKENNLWKTTVELLANQRGERKWKEK